MTTPPDVKVDEILARYGLDRERAGNYVDAIIRMNQKEAADEIGVSRRTINQKDKKAFADMTPDERDLVLLSLSQERCLERLARLDRDTQTETGDSAAEDVDA